MTPTHSAGGVSFGNNYAILNLDLMTILVDTAKGTAAGDTFIHNFSRWNETVHRKEPRPLTIFTSLSLSSGEPELARDAPFTKLVHSFGSFEAGSKDVGLSPSLLLDENDIVLQKTRWYAGAGNSLEQILRAQKVDTVIISGLTLSGVVMSTIYRLFDLDYNIYVIYDNVLELPVDDHSEAFKVVLETVLSKMNLTMLSVQEALEALARS
ncbi:hypothetical protein CDD83_3046 [Cordyceps sp. RAO-2017]|nr:hypothetical protein CDD83_3046 [Cordyceps sp. RAO-2017]